MAHLSVALDEDVSHRLAGLLRFQGWDADSAKELGRLGLSDTRVLLAAAEHRQTLVTHNENDFRTLHEAWVTMRRLWGTEAERATGMPVTLSRHAGILIVPHLPERDLARILEEFEATAGTIDDRLFMWTRLRRWHELRF